MFELTFDSIKNVKNKDAKIELGLAISDILHGISKEWSLDVDDMAMILCTSNSVIESWTQYDNSIVDLDSVDDSSLLAILDFIDLYNLVTSTFPLHRDRIKWFKGSSTDADSPMMRIIRTGRHSIKIEKDRLEMAIS